MALLEVKNATFSYNGKNYALKGVSFSAEKGEHIAIVGHNGSGKSTFARLLNGLLVPTSGEVKVDGFYDFGQLLLGKLIYDKRI
ncbi:MAG: ATP-binding cassette domain-containing protein [Clostridia bacterium]|nr:ATP-binding cassette domain-containing protein [Clostridia bacterium]